MAKKNKTYASGIESKKYFKTPLFLVMAILVTLIPIAIIARIVTAGAGIVLLFGLLFSIISAVNVWIVFAGRCEIKKVKKCCRIISYTRFLSTLVTIAVICLAAVLSIGLVIGAVTGSAGLFDAADKLEYDVKPIIKGLIISSEDIDANIAFYGDVLTPSNITTNGIWLGVNNVDNLKVFAQRWSTVASYVMIFLDDIIDFARSNLLVFSLIVTAVLALVCVAMCFVNSALKKAVRQLLVISTGINGFKKGHRFAICVGATVLVLTGLVMFFFDTILAAVPILLGSILYVLAMMFGDVKFEKTEEEKSFAEANEIAEAAKITVTDF